VGGKSVVRKKTADVFVRVVLTDNSHIFAVTKNQRKQSYDRSVCVFFPGIAKAQSDKKKKNKKMAAAVVVVVVRSGKFDIN
jgi:hypothetical protein